MRCDGASRWRRDGVANSHCTAASADLNPPAAASHSSVDLLSLYSYLLILRLSSTKIDKSMVEFIVCPELHMLSWICECPVEAVVV